MLSCKDHERLLSCREHVQDQQCCIMDIVYCCWFGDMSIGDWLLVGRKQTTCCFNHTNSVYTGFRGFPSNRHLPSRSSASHLSFSRRCHAVIHIHNAIQRVSFALLTLSEPGGPVGGKDTTCYTVGQKALMLSAGLSSCAPILARLIFPQTMIL